MFRRIRFFSFLLSSFSITSWAQSGDSYYQNAFQFSQSQSFGSARTLGFAGAQTALGADLGSLSSNPAGLGLFRKSEYNFSPNFNVPSTNSTVFNNVVGDSKLTLNVNNLGVAFCNIKDDIVQSKWRGGTFAIGVTRTANYQNAFTYQGYNNKNAFADYLVENANGYYGPYNPYLPKYDYNKNNISNSTDLAWGTYAINPDTLRYNNGQPIYDSTGSPYFNTDDYYNKNLGYYKNQLPSPGTVQQKESVNQSGGMYEWSAGYGGNYNNRLFFGATLSLVTLKYNVTKHYTETLVNTPHPTVDMMTSLTYDESLKSHGTGVNMTLGMTGVINDYLRLGISYKTPSYIGINETYNSTMTTTFTNLVAIPSSGTKSTVPQTNHYTLFTPGKLNVGASFFINKYGFLTGEIEYLDYSAAKLGGSNSTYYINANSNIKQAYKSVLNYKLGAEIRADIVRFRVGYAVYASPWKQGIDDANKRIRSNDMQVFTLGIGVRTSGFFLDLAYGRSTYNSNYSPYLLAEGTEPQVVINNVMNTVTLGGGVFF
jgi:hypothetical protein